MKFLYIILFCLVLVVTGNQVSFGNETDLVAEETVQQIDLVWTQSDGLRKEIFISTFSGGQWSKSLQLTDDNANNLHPAVDTDADGQKWIVWTAIDQNGYSIQVMSIQGEKKSEVQTVSSGIPANIFPTVIVDAQNTPWVIWSGIMEQNDDIYFSRRVHGRWCEPRCLHHSNDVPDIQPVVRLNKDGTPVVQWNRFVDGTYKAVVSSWLGTEWSPVRVVKKDVDQDNEEQPLLPDKMPEAMENGQSLFIKMYKSALKN